MIGLVLCPAHAVTLDLSEVRSAGGLDAVDVYVCPCPHGHDVVFAVEAVEGRAP